MANPNISAAISDADKQAIAAAAATIKSKLPFAVTLSAEERQALPKLGEKTAAFVQAALLGAQQHPEILPPTFDVAEFGKDAALFSDMLEVSGSVGPVLEAIEHTTMAVGSEAFAAARTFYEYLKTAAKTQPGLQGLVDQLGERFQQTRTAKATAKKPTV